MFASVVLFCVSFVSIVLPFPQNIVEVGRLAWEVNNDLQQLREEIEGVRQEQVLYRGIDDIHRKLRRIIHETNFLEDQLFEMLNKWLQTRSLDLKEDYLSHKQKVDQYYDHLTEHAKPNNYERSTVEKFVDSILSNLKGPPVNYMAHINEFDRKLRDDEKGTVLCEVRQSPQQILYDYYNFLMTIEIKSHVSKMYALYYKKTMSLGEYDEEISDQEKLYQNRINYLSRCFKKEIQRFSPILWRCDPKEHIAGETYEELTRLFQGYILNEQNLSQDGKCYKKCENYKYVEPQCRDHTWCQRQPRCSKALDCKTIPSSNMGVTFKRFNKRRYENIHLSKGNKFFGSKDVQGNCKTQGLDVFYSRIFYRCDYCFCICDQSGVSSDRYLSLRAAFVNYKSNRVVTGVRFVKINRIVHLQVQEGKLQRFGTVDNATVQWVPVKKYRITDRDMYNRQDYQTFDFDEKAVDLDDLEADPGYVIIGVRFRRTVDTHPHVTLEIIQERFNFETGRLDPEEKILFKYNSGNKKAIKLTRPDVPTKTKEPSKPNLARGQYVEFTNTDMEKDAAQITVPFFDFQPVESKVAVPLTGVGLFYKGQIGFGGFIVPKIITYNVSNHIMEVF